MACFFVSCCALLSLLVGGLGAATLDVRFAAEQGRQADPLYPGVSTVSAAATGLPGVLATLAGRGYGAEAVSTVRWGILAGPLSGNNGTSGWTLREGFAPDKLGSTLSSKGGVDVAASYLSVLFSGVTAGTVFKNVSLHFGEVSSLRDNKAWVGTSADAFATSSNLKFSAKGGSPQFSVTLPDFTYLGGAPLEIRIYGVLGDDEGSFRGFTVAGDATAPIPVPEPDVRILVTAIGLGALVSFRRRANAVPR